MSKPQYRLPKPRPENMTDLEMRIYMRIKSDHGGGAPEGMASHDSRLLAEALKEITTLREASERGWWV